MLCQNLWKGKLINYLPATCFDIIGIPVFSAMGNRFCLLLLLVGNISFPCINGDINKDFHVIELALDGIETNPKSIATLVDHEPSIPFPDVFTFCWRSCSTFVRDLWTWNHIEIPSNPEKRFLAFYQVDNGTNSLMYGKEHNKIKLL